MAYLARVTQLQGESVEKYIARFRKLRTRCQTSLTEKECVSLALNFNMREKFERQEFTDLFHLATRTTSVERLLKENKERVGYSPDYRCRRVDKMPDFDGVEPTII